MTQEYNFSEMNENELWEYYKKLTEEKLIIHRELVKRGGWK